MLRLEWWPGPGPGTLRSLTWIEMDFHDDAVLQQERGLATQSLDFCDAERYICTKLKRVFGDEHTTILEKRGFHLCESAE